MMTETLASGTRSFYRVHTNRAMALPLPVFFIHPTEGRRPSWPAVLLSPLCPPAPLKSLTFWRYTNQIIIMVALRNRAVHYIFAL